MPGGPNSASERSAPAAAYEPSAPTRLRNALRGPDSASECSAPTAAYEPSADPQLGFGTWV